MRKVDTFFVVIMLLFCGLGTSYMAFDYHFSGVQIEKSKNVVLEKQVKELNLVITSLEEKSNPSKRGIASVAAAKSISLDGFYKEQIREARAAKDASKVNEIAQKIISSSIDPELLAEAYFGKAEISCATYLIKENSCLADIEILVSQFPESVWAGEGLIVLSTVYSKQKRYKEANSLIQIVKNEFASQKKLIVKADQLEKSML
ncbi:MAG: hypothetical protein H7256_13205 [Bdellovibrio sp.]|nr:hypothetical protein [Bdellovibrio sp.]